MISRGKKILMMVEDDNTKNNKNIEEPTDNENCSSDNTFAEEIESSKTIDPDTRTRIETWIDKSVNENQDPNVIDSISINLSAETVHKTMVENEGTTYQEPSNNLQLIETPSNLNKDNTRAISNSSSTPADVGDFEPSEEGSEYKLPVRGKNKIIPLRRSKSSSSTSSSNTSTSSSNSSSSSSSSSSSDSDTPILETEANIEPESNVNMNQSRSRKRQRNTQNWKSNISKRLKNSGQEYITKRGKTVPSKSIGPACKDTCRLQCSRKFTPEIRNQIFNDYWNLGDLQRQRDFIASCVTIITPQSRRVTIKPNNNKPPRRPNASFYFSIRDEEKIRVCKTFLVNTLSIGEKILRTIIEQKSENVLNICATDGRGRHGKQCKLSAELRQSVRDHINSIPRTESHYLRANTTREFIDGSWTIAELHRSYVSLRKAAGKEAVNYDAYHRMFNSEFNIGLFIPRKDQCDECETYKNAVDKSPLSAKYTAHLEEKTLAQDELKKDTREIEINAETNDVMVIFDLQAVLPCPIGQSSSFFYKSKLNCYNFTVSNINEDNTFCYFWHEGLGKRGANEIGSCLYNFLQQLSLKQPNKDVIFYSDNCCGQQKNKFVFGLYYYAVNHLSIKSITHKFLVRGHTHNKADAVHSTIEKSVTRTKKAGPIYTPSQYISIIRNSRKKEKPFIVTEMNYDSFYNLKLLFTELAINFAKNTHGGNIKVTEMKAIKFTKSSELYQYKTSFKADTWTEANVILEAPPPRPSKTGRPGTTGRTKTTDNTATTNRKDLKDIVLSVLSTEKLPIPPRKKQDIKDLIAANIVPKFYEQFYNSIF